MTPKSRTTTRPSGSTRMFEGFTSRCTFCAACSAARARARDRNEPRRRSSSKACPAASRGRSGDRVDGRSSGAAPRASRTTERVTSASWLDAGRPHTYSNTLTPWTSSMVKNHEPSSSNSSPRRTRFSCWRSWSARNSRLKRRRESASIRWSVFRATCARCSRSTASKTTPIPPAPSSRRISNRSRAQRRVHTRSTACPFLSARAETEIAPWRAGADQGGGCPRRLQLSKTSRENRPCRARPHFSARRRDPKDRPRSVRKVNR